MEPLRPGQRLLPLLLIRDQEKKLARAERLGRVFRFHDDHRDRLPGHGNQTGCKLIGWLRVQCASNGTDKRTLEFRGGKLDV
jgi:hypothetical protein